MQYDVWHCYVAEVQQWITKWMPAGTAPDEVSMVDADGTPRLRPVMFRHQSAGCPGHVGANISKV